MKLDYKVLFQLFRSTFSLSAFTFGGGYVIVPFDAEEVCGRV